MPDDRTAVARPTHAGSPIRMRGAAALARAVAHGFAGHRRTAVIAVAVVLVAACGALIARVPGSGPRNPDRGARPEDSLRAHADRARAAEVARRFEQAVVMLHARRHDHAVTALHRVLELAPEMPEAHVNMGFALLGLKRYPAARDFFESALALRAGQLNAYYGLAIALEELRDLAGARGAMRTYVHLAPPDDPFRRRAEAALWEWENPGAADAAKAQGPRR